jgi:hypothetical protein
MKIHFLWQISLLNLSNAVENIVISLSCEFKTMFEIDKLEKSDT